MKKFFGLFTLIGILFFFVWSTFYLLEERKESWRVVIKQLPKNQLIKSFQGFQTSKKYKKYLISIFAKTALEYKNNDNNRWTLKDITVKVQIFSSSVLNTKKFTLRSSSAIFDQKEELLFFTDTVYMDLPQYLMEVKALRYNLKTNQLFSSKEVLIKNSSFVILSNGFQFFLNQWYLKLFSGVELKFKNSLIGSGIKSQELSYNFKDHFVFNKQVRIFHKTYKGFSDQLVFNDFKENIQYILNANVSLFVGGHKFKGEKVLFSPVDQSVEIKHGSIQIDESLSF